jgi:hypothetical protein
MFSSLAFLDLASLDGDHERDRGAFAVSQGNASALPCFSLTARAFVRMRPPGLDLFKYLLEQFVEPHRILQHGVMSGGSCIQNLEGHSCGLQPG